MSFYGASYIHLPVQEAKGATDISFRFRTHLADAMLLLAAGKTDYCLIKLEAGRLKVRLPPALISINRLSVFGAGCLVVVNRPHVLHDTPVRPLSSPVSLRRNWTRRDTPKKKKGNCLMCAKYSTARGTEGKKRKDSSHTDVTLDRVSAILIALLDSYFSAKEVARLQRHDYIASEKRT